MVRKSIPFLLEGFAWRVGGPKGPTLRNDPLGRGVRRVQLYAMTLPFQWSASQFPFFWKDVPGVCREGWEGPNGPTLRNDPKGGGVRRVQLYAMTLRVGGSEGSNFTQ